MIDSSPPPLSESTEFKYRQMIRDHLRGISRTQAMVKHGYNPDSYKMWSDPRFLNILADERSMLESELLNCRETLAFELLQLARDPKTPAASRISAYRTLGKWAGLDREPERAPLGLPGKPQDAALPADCEVEGVVDGLRKQHKTSPKP